MLEQQAAQVAASINRTFSRGSAPCPGCGNVVNPVEFLYNKGLCQGCRSIRAQSRVKGRLAS
jgi:Zn finger protein HypA/HybF involved in hydrogenase expression